MFCVRINQIDWEGVIVVLALSDKKYKVCCWRGVGVDKQMRGFFRQRNKRAFVDPLAEKSMRGKNATKGRGSNGRPEREKVDKLKRHLCGP